MNPLANSLNKYKGAFVALALLISVLLGLYFWISDSSQSMVQDMCEKDGGLKVMETVSINPALYKQLAQPNGEISIPHKSTSHADVPFFIESSEKVYYRHPRMGGFPGVLRVETRYIQRDSNKLLATFVYYEISRSGSVGGQPVFSGKCAPPSDGLTKQFIKVQGTEKL